MIRMTRMLAILLFSASMLATGAARSAEPEKSGDGIELAQACGWYAIVGCSRSSSDAASIAPQGTYVIDTNFYPNFSNGWFCAVDGPYPSRSAVPLGHWRQFRGDAYVKSAC